MRSFWWAYTLVRLRPRSRRSEGPQHRRAGSAHHAPAVVGCGPTKLNGERQAIFEQRFPIGESGAQRHCCNEGFAHAEEDECNVNRAANNSCNRERLRPRENFDIAVR